MIWGLDHCEAAAACKSESAKNGGIALVFAAGCEANHMRVTGLALIRVKRGRLSQPRIEPMKARRMAYWWFRFVVSGRFLEKFLRLRRP
jgi:hypothetical protein